jgi:hypothetical protein
VVGRALRKAYTQCDLLNFSAQKEEHMAVLESPLKSEVQVPPSSSRYEGSLARAANGPVATGAGDGGGGGAASRGMLTSGEGIV